jgi:BASS family bile acid:Na+ symporter
MKFIESNAIFWVFALSSLALFFPTIFSFLLNYISYMLALVMFFMGITINKEEMFNALKNWKFAVLGTFLQFFLMPLIAFIIAIIFQLPIEYKLGLLLVGSCPGGTASNVIVYLFKGDVTLSVLMTFMSTVLSVVMTPLLLGLYMGKTMVLPIDKMIVDILQFVLFPIIIGILIRKFSSTSLLKTIEYSSTTVAVLVISLIVASIVSVNVDVIQKVPIVLIVSVILHNVFGYLLGYLCARIFTKDKKIARTISIEVGMQNSGLGVVLANIHFTKIVALPSAIFSLWHNISGLVLARYWNDKSK